MYTTHGHQIKGTPVEGERPHQVTRCGGPLVCLECSRQSAVAQERLAEPVQEKLVHNEDTLTKVYDSLVDYGMTFVEARGIVSDMQNKGILFRENA